jgi:hypothetical protein
LPVRGAAQRTEPDEATSRIFRQFRSFRSCHQKVTASRT